MRKDGDINIQIKALDDKKGYFIGIASTYGNEDREGDIMARGAFDSILDGALVPVFYEHSAKDKIGEGRLYKTSEGLRIEGKLYLEGDNQVAKNVYENLVNKDYEHKPSFSIGFISKKWENREDDSWGRIFKEIEIFETSIVSIPANPQAQLISAKNFDTIRDCERYLKNGGLSQSKSKKGAKALFEALNEEQREVVESQRDVDVNQSVNVDELKRLIDDNLKITK